MIDAFGDFYEKTELDGWVRVSQDGSILGNATKRESRLLDYIVGEVPKSRNMCVVCGKNWVDVENGFDTCEECARKI